MQPDSCDKRVQEAGNVSKRRRGHRRQARRNISYRPPPLMKVVQKAPHGLPRPQPPPAARTASAKIRHSKSHTLRKSRSPDLERLSAGCDFVLDHGKLLFPAVHEPYTSEAQAFHLQRYRVHQRSKLTLNSAGRLCAPPHGPARGTHNKSNGEQIM